MKKELGVECSFEILVGKKLEEVIKLGRTENTFTDLVIITDSGSLYIFTNNDPDCFVETQITSIEGDLQLLIGKPIIKADKVYNEVDAGGDEDDLDFADSIGLTTITLATERGEVNVTWRKKCSYACLKEVELYRLKSLDLEGVVQESFYNN